MTPPALHCAVGGGFCGNAGLGSARGIGHTSVGGCARTGGGSGARYSGTKINVFTRACEGDSDGSAIPQTARTATRVT